MLLEFRCKCYGKIARKEEFNTTVLMNCYYGKWHIYSKSSKDIGHSYWSMTSKKSNLQFAYEIHADNTLLRIHLLFVVDCFGCNKSNMPKERHRLFCTESKASMKYEITNVTSHFYTIFQAVLKNKICMSKLERSFKFLQIYKK